MPSKSTLRRWIKEVEKQNIDVKLEDLRQGIRIGLRCALHNWRAVEFLRFGNAARQLGHTARYPRASFGEGWI
jgi:hypothetical protein